MNEQAELAGDVGVDIINTVRKFKSERQMSLKEELAEVIVMSDEKGFQEIIQSIVKDLGFVLNVKKISFEGKTDLETPMFKVKVGIRT